MNTHLTIIEIYIMLYLEHLIKLYSLFLQFSLYFGAHNFIFQFSNNLIDHRKLLALDTEDHSFCYGQQSPGGGISKEWELW